MESEDSTIQMKIYLIEIERSSVHLRIGFWLRLHSSLFQWQKSSIHFDSSLILFLFHFVLFSALLLFVSLHFISSLFFRSVPFFCNALDLFLFVFSIFRFKVPVLRHHKKSECCICHLLSLLHKQFCHFHLLCPSIFLNTVLFVFHALMVRKRWYLTQSYDKIPYTAKKSIKATWQHKNANKNFDYTTVADRLRMVSLGNDSHRTGVVQPVYGIPTFPLTAKAL